MYKIALSVTGTNGCLFSDKYKTHKYSVGRAYSCWMLNCWCITWPVGFKGLKLLNFMWTTVYWISKWTKLPRTLTLSPDSHQIGEVYLNCGHCCSVKLVLNPGYVLCPWAFHPNLTTGVNQQPSKYSILGRFRTWQSCGEYVLQLGDVHIPHHGAAGATSSARRTRFRHASLCAHAPSCHLAHSVLLRVDHGVFCWPGDRPHNTQVDYILVFWFCGDRSSTVVKVLYYK